MMLSIEEVSFNLISVLEGMRLNAYKDSRGIWTIGFGHTLNVTPSMSITREEALNFFAEDTKSLIDRVRKFPLQEAAAWVSFGYNCGLPTLEIVLKEDLDHMLLYNKAGSYVSLALSTRRTLEWTLIKLSRGNK